MIDEDKAKLSSSKDVQNVRHKYGQTKRRFLNELTIGIGLDYFRLL